MFQDLISYRGALLKFNQNNFDRKLWAYPKKGTAGYNQIQHLRKGEEAKPAKTIAELTKPEAPIVLEKKKDEKKEEEKKEKKEKAKKEKKPKKEKKVKKEKAKKDTKKEKTAKKENAVKAVIANLIKEEDVPKNEIVKTEEAPATKVEVSGLKKNVYSKVEPMSASLLLALLEKLAVIVKKAETSGYGASDDGKALLAEYKEARKPLEIYDIKEVELGGKTYAYNQSDHPRNVLRKENKELLEKVKHFDENRIQHDWALRMHYEQEEKKKEELNKKQKESEEYWKTVPEPSAEEERKAYEEFFKGINERMKVRREEKKAEEKKDAPAPQVEEKKAENPEKHWYYLALTKRLKEVEAEPEDRRKKNRIEHIQNHLQWFLAGSDRSSVDLNHKPEDWMDIMEFEGMKEGFVVGMSNKEMMDELKDKYVGATKEDFKKIVAKYEGWRKREQKDSEVYKIAKPFVEELEKLKEELKKDEHNKGSRGYKGIEKQIKVLETKLKNLRAKSANPLF